MEPEKKRKLLVEELLGCTKRGTRLYFERWILWSWDGEMMGELKDK